ncbi:ASKHA domain-containing protein [Desulfobacterium sp. N47]|uniref:2Fe-2S ferredoxin-type domain-containing protein n=1 Tax=uncultured Desulfobacterium sp. TaxID=201089 RepID=E1Y8S1_9BACT|nr:hypothetical protein N47_A09940 [uncultured Desulfobacterium sp.]
MNRTDQKTEHYKLDFEPVGLRGQCDSDKSLLECAHQLGINIKSVCGGYGKCRSCKIKILDGTVSEPAISEKEILSSKERERGWCLACKTYPLSDRRLYLPPESITAPQRAQTEGLEIDIAPEPVVNSYKIAVNPASFSDLRGDADRILETINLTHNISCSSIDIDVMRNLSPKLREWNWMCNFLVRKDEAIGLSLSDRKLGFAVDLGTTKIAGYLVDLESGKTLAAEGIMNPQIGYGEDIISRITHAIQSPAEATRLKNLAINSLNNSAKDLCLKIGAKTDEITDAVIVGNTAIHHLLLNLPVKQLAESPFIPAVRKSLDIKARDAGLQIAPGAFIHLLPNIAGFVGADHTAALLSVDAENIKGVELVIDIGTNTEISLIVNGEIVSASCASGPAFEGGHIKCGMRASGGAIEDILILNGKTKYQTIDGAPPVGICGSGIPDALAQLYLAGIIDKGGRMSKDHPGVRNNGKYPEFVLVSEEERNGQAAIVVTQSDIRELQLAKAAIRTGIQLLLEAKGCAEYDITRVIIAGAFGSYINVASAVAVGLLPCLPYERFKQVGNAAGIGAKMALISSEKRLYAQNLASRTQYIELSTVPAFMPTFVQAGYLGLYRLSGGKRMEIDKE